MSNYKQLGQGQRKLETYGIQSISLRMIRDYLTKENPSLDIVDRLNFYMDILFRDKAVDFDNHDKCVDLYQAIY